MASTHRIRGIPGVWTGLMLAAAIMIMSPAHAADGRADVPGPVAGVADQAEVDARPVAHVIDEYVHEALRSNLSLQSESLEVERNIAALDAARARYLPT